MFIFYVMKAKTNIIIIFVTFIFGHFNYSMYFMSYVNKLIFLSKRYFMFKLYVYYWTNLIYYMVVALSLFWTFWQKISEFIVAKYPSKPCGIYRFYQAIFEATTPIPKQQLWASQDSLLKMVFEFKIQILNLIQSWKQIQFYSRNNFLFFWVVMRNCGLFWTRILQSVFTLLFSRKRVGNWPGIFRFVEEKNQLQPTPIHAQVYYNLGTCYAHVLLISWSCWTAILKQKIAVRIQT